MSQTLDNIDLLAIAQSVKLAGCNDEGALPPNSSVPIDLTARFVGTLERGKSSTRAGTNRARSVPTICLLLQELGCTREYAPVHIIDLWNRLAGLTKKSMEDHVAATCSTTEPRQVHLGQSLQCQKGCQHRQG